MLTFLSKLLLAILGLASGLGAILFALVTFLAICMLFHAWFDRGFDFKDRCLISLILSFSILWGGLLTYLAGDFAVNCLT